MAKRQRHPKSMTAYQMKRAVGEGKIPFLVWKRHGDPNCKRIFWSPSYPHFRDVYPEFRWEGVETSLTNALTYAIKENNEMGSS